LCLKLKLKLKLKHMNAIIDRDLQRLSCYCGPQSGAYCYQRLLMMAMAMTVTLLTVG